MKKVFCLFAFILFVLAFGGCEGKDIIGLEPSPEKTDLLDTVHEIADSSTYEPKSTDYEYMKEKEFNLRLVVEANNFYMKEKEDNSLESGEFVQKYGIEQYWREGNWISFENIEDMEIVFSSKDFKTDCSSLFGVEFDVHSYYLPENIITDRYDIDIVVKNENYYFNISGAERNDDASFFVVWGVFASSAEFEVKELAELYADMDNNELHSDTATDGYDVYYFTAVGGCTLFEALGVVSNRPTTAYLWEQDEILGVIIYLGEHSEENLDLCVLEKHEIEE